MAANPPTHIGVTAASVPPQIMASASPRWMMRKESPMQWALVVQAVAVAEFGPLAPARIETWPEARLTMVAGNEERRNATRAVLEQGEVLALNHLEAADAAADVDTHHVGVLRGNRQPGIPDGLVAAEVKGFDPARYIEKKEIKKMGRFIQFAIAASDCALSNSGLKVTPETEEMVGVYIGSGIGGFEVIEREHQVLLEHGPAPHLPIFHSRHHRESGLGPCLDSLRRQGPQLRHRYRLHHQRPLHRRFFPHDPAR